MAAKSVSKVETQEVRPQRSRRRMLWAPFLVLLPVVLAGTAIAAGPILLGDTRSVLDATALEFHKPTEQPLGNIAAPTPSMSGQTPAVIDAPHVSVVPLYTPPPPAAKKRSGARSGGEGAGVPYTTFCPGATAAYTPGSSLSGWMTTLNNERARIGSPPLKWSSSLASKAQGWSNTMASKDDETPGTLGGALSHNPSGGYENVAMNYDSSNTSQSRAVRTAHYGLMASSGHCKNIMNPALRYVGIGGAQTADGVWYFTQNFSK